MLPMGSSRRRLLSQSTVRGANSTASKERHGLWRWITRPTLAALPAEDYVFAHWQFARVGLDYHIEVEGFFYSVPFGLIGQQVEVRVTQRTIEAFHKGGRVAAHARRYAGRAHGTQAEHMPNSHRRYAAWSPVSAELRN